MLLLLRAVRFRCKCVCELTPEERLVDLAQVGFRNELCIFNSVSRVLHSAVTLLLVLLPAHHAGQDLSMGSLPNPRLPSLVRSGWLARSPACPVANALLAGNAGVEARRRGPGDSGSAEGRGGKERKKKLQEGLARKARGSIINERQEIENGRFIICSVKYNNGTTLDTVKPKPDSRPSRVDRWPQGQCTAPRKTG